MDQLDRIALTGIRGTGFHGVFDEERADGQEFVVDVVVFVDLAAATRSDDLGDTVDYGRLAANVVTRIEGESVNLIETLAARIAADILSHPLVAGTTVTVHKPHAPIPVPFGDVAVTVHRGAGDCGGVRA